MGRLCSSKCRYLSQGAWRLTATAILFPSASAADRLVAGIPCAARALHSLVQSGTIAECENCVLAVPGGWSAAPHTRSEISRLSPLLEISCTSIEASASDPNSVAIDGIAAIAFLEGSPSRSVTSITTSPAFASKAAALQVLDAASRQIVTATSKATDGIVSRWINRPVSQFVSHLLLRTPWTRPGHATAAAAAVGLAMVLSLFFGGEAGLVAGAVLFQLASIIDGVDGELARASLRTSRLGATLDSANDAATNCAFVAGVSFNLWQQGQTLGAQAGLVGLGCLIIGLTLLGIHSMRRGSGLNFEVLKHRMNAMQSPLMRVLGRVVSRDVYAFAFALLILAGLPTPAMVGFTGAASLWLAVVIVALLRSS